MIVSNKGKNLKKFVRKCNMLKLKGKRKTKNTIVVFVGLLLVAAVIIIALSLYGRDMMGKIPGLSFNDALTIP
jgi:hypothetical protein